MSVGGKVTEVVFLEDKVWVNTFDGHEECAVYCEKNYNSNEITEGDRFWWQSGNCYWTKYDGEEYVGLEEVVIPKISASGVDKPIEYYFRFYNDMLSKEQIISYLSNFPLGYVTERDHEITEQLINRLIMGFLELSPEYKPEY